MGVGGQLVEDRLQAIDQGRCAQPVVAPDHHRPIALAACSILVVHPFDEPGAEGATVVVPCLRQGDLHLVIAVTVAHPLKAVGLCDRGLDQLGHFDINDPVDFLGVTRDHLVGHGFSTDYGYRDGPQAADHRVGIEHYVLASQKVERTGADGLDPVGAQLRGLKHVDGARAQRVLERVQGSFVGLCAAGLRVAQTAGQTGPHIHPAGAAVAGVDQAPNIDIARRIEPDLVLGRDGAAGVHFTCAQVDPVVGANHGRVGVATLALDEQGLVGNYLKLCAASPGVESCIGIEIDVFAGDADPVVGVQVGVDLGLRLGAAGDRDRVHPRRKYTCGAGLVELADGAIQAHHAAAAQADRATLGGVDDGAIETHRRASHLLVGRVGARADAVGDQAVALGHHIGDGI